MADETMQTAETARTPAAEPGLTPATAPGLTPATTEPSVLAGASTPESTPESAPAPEPAPKPEPVTYTDFRLPEGATIDAAALDQARALFAQAGLPQDEAQKFVDLAVSREQAAAARGVQAFVDLQNKWVSEIKADPEIGGVRLEASMAQAARAIDRLGVPGLKEALNLTGAGNNPAIVKAFVRLGQMVSEDRFAPGRAAAPPASRSPAETIYDGNPRQSQ